MKITQKQLKQIIEEEIQSLKETSIHSDWHNDPRWDEWGASQGGATSAAAKKAPKEAPAKVSQGGRAAAADDWGDDPRWDEWSAYQMEEAEEQGDLQESDMTDDEYRWHWNKRYKKRDAFGNRIGNKPAPRAEGRDDAIVGAEKRSQEDLGYDDSQYQNYVGGYDDGLKWSENNPHRKRHADKILAKRSDQKVEEGFGDRAREYFKGRKGKPSKSKDDMAAATFLRQMRARGAEEPENVSTDKSYADRFSSAKKRKLEEDISLDTPYGVVNIKTGDVVYKTTYKHRNKARAMADKKDLEYGAHKFAAKILKTEKSEDKNNVKEAEKMKMTEEKLKNIIFEQIKSMKESWKDYDPDAGGHGSDADQPVGKHPLDEETVEENGPQIPDLFRMADQLEAIAQNSFNSEDQAVLRKAEEILRNQVGFSEGLTKRQADDARRRQQAAADKRAGLAPTEDVPGVDVKAMYRKQQKDIKAADRKRKARAKGKQK
jgi:hypothetical protein